MSQGGQKFLTFNRQFREQDALRVERTHEATA